MFHHRRVKKYFSVPGEVVELALSTPTAGEILAPTAASNKSSAPYGEYPQACISLAAPRASSTKSHVKYAPAGFKVCRMKRATYSFRAISPMLKR